MKRWHSRICDLPELADHLNELQEAQAWIHTVSTFHEYVPPTDVMPEYYLPRALIVYHLFKRERKH